jgi:hypothetical protein
MQHMSDVLSTWPVSRSFRQSRVFGDQPSYVPDDG